MVFFSSSSSFIYVIYTYIEHKFETWLLVHDVLNLNKREEISYQSESEGSLLNVKRFD